MESTTIVVVISFRSVFIRPPPNRQTERHNFWVQFNLTRLGLRQRQNNKKRTFSSFPLLLFSFNRIMSCYGVVVSHCVVKQPTNQKKKKKTKQKAAGTVDFLLPIASQQKSFAAWLMPRLNNSNDVDDDDDDTMKLEFVQVLVVVGSWAGWCRVDGRTDIYFLLFLKPCHPPLIPVAITFQTFSTFLFLCSYFFLLLFMSKGGGGDAISCRTRFRRSLSLLSLSLPEKN